MVRSQRQIRLAKGAAKDVAVVAPDQEVERVNGSAGSARLAVHLLRVVAQDKPGDSSALLTYSPTWIMTRQLFARTRHTLSCVFSGELIHFDYDCACLFTSAATCMFPPNAAEYSGAGFMHADAFTIATLTHGQAAIYGRTDRPDGLRSSWVFGTKNGHDGFYPRGSEPTGAIHRFHSWRCETAYSAHASSWTK